MWGLIEVHTAARVCNLTHHGALIESPQPLAVESIHAIGLMVDGEHAVADAKVRHSRRVASSDRYLVGVEFVAAPTAFLAAVDRLVEFRAYPANNDSCTS